METISRVRLDHFKHGRSIKEIVRLRGISRNSVRKIIRSDGISDPHYLVEHTACSPAAGWEKGQVENQVKNGRDAFIKPRQQAQKLAELNARLYDQKVERAKRMSDAVRLGPGMIDKQGWLVFRQAKPGGEVAIPFRRG